MAACPRTRRVKTRRRREFTKSDVVEFDTKLDILRLVKSHAENEGWRFEGMTRQVDFAAIGPAHQFCERCKGKGSMCQVWGMTSGISPARCFSKKHGA